MPAGWMRRLAVLVVAAALAGCAGRSEPAPESYLGTYALEHDPGESGFEVTLLPDGEARSTANGPDTITRGTWAVTPGGVRIRWADGWKNEIASSGSGWIQRSWSPERSFEDSPLKEVPARRLDHRVERD